MMCAIKMGHESVLVCKTFLKSSLECVEYYKFNISSQRFFSRGAKCTRRFAKPRSS